jgi:hypothetical protein
MTTTRARIQLNLVELSGSVAGEDSDPVSMRCSFICHVPVAIIVTSDESTMNCAGIEL